MQRLATYRTVPFRLDHLDCMDIRAHEQDILTAGMLECAAASAEAHTVIHDGRVVACFGALLMDDGKAELWQIPSVYVEQYIVKYARYTREWLEKIQKQYNIRRMDTVSLDDRLHKRWMQFLGFEQEGLKRKYYNEHDYIMWGKLWDSDQS